MKKSIILSWLLLLIVCTGCAPVVSTIRTSDPVSSKEENCELVIYWPGVQPSDNAQVIGKISIGDSGFTTDCEYETVLGLAKREACKLGADALKIISLKEPDGFTSTCYRIKGQAVTFANDPIKKIDMSEDEIRAYLDENINILNPIEGIWTSTDNAYQVGILKDIQSPGLKFHGIIIRSDYSSWTPGSIKAELEKTATRNIFMMNYYMRDHSKQGTTAFLKEDALLEFKVRDVTNQSEFTMALLKNYPPVIGMSDSSPDAEVALSSGTGFFITSDGYLITAQHVVEVGNEIEIITSDGKAVSAKVVKSSKMIDVALLKADVENVPFVEIAQAGITNVGDDVFTVGYPAISTLGSEPKYTDGVVSSMSGIKGDATFIQVTVPVQPGNSGGALLNEKGAVIGVVTSTAAIQPFLRDTGTLPQNINWAVNIAFVRPLLPTDLKTSNQELTKRVAIDSARAASCLLKVSK